MNETRVGVVAEVERAQVEEVDDQDQFGPVEVRANEEHDKGKVEEVVDDEMASNARRSVHDVRIGGEEMANVASLQDKEHNPVDGGDDRVHGKGTGVERVLVPNALADRVAIVRRVNGVVDGDDDGQHPGDEREDLVGGHRSRAVGLALGEGIDCGR